MGFYTNDPSALPQLDVRNSIARFLLPLADMVPTGSCFANAAGKEAPAGVGSERSIAKSVNMYPLALRMTHGQLFQWIKLTARYLTW